MVDDLRPGIDSESLDSPDRAFPDKRRRLGLPESSAIDTTAKTWVKPEWYLARRARRSQTQSYELQDVTAGLATAPQSVECEFLRSLASARSVGELIGAGALAAGTSRDARVRDARLWLAAGFTNSTVTQPRVELAAGSTSSAVPQQQPCTHTAVLRAALG